MAPEVLVMCPACGRPQHATGKVCVQCGAPLPEVPAQSAPPSARDQLLESFEPVMIADLGGGRGLRLSARRLEWKNSAKSTPVTFELAGLRSVSLRRRRAWEALLFLVPAAVALLISSNPVPRAIVVGLMAWSVAACLLQRRFALHLEPQRGQSVDLVLGIARPTAMLGQRIGGLWSSLSEELGRLGVDVRM